MAELVLGPHNGLTINGTRPRRPKTRKKDINKPKRSTDLNDRTNDNTDSELTSTASSVTPAMATATLTTTTLQPTHIMDLDQSSSQQWRVEALPDNNYRITIHSVSDVTDFLRALSLSTFRSNTTLLSTARERNTRVVVPLPYINYHSELYAKTIARPMTGCSVSDLPTIVSDCVFYFMECMNHYYPIRPKSLLIPWYMALGPDDLCSNPLALAIGVYWCRHVLIHHPPTRTVKDSRILDAIQHQLSKMARDVLGDCFDEPHVDHLFALCLCNMTAAFSIKQKTIFHTIAVGMATELGIEPRQPGTHPHEDDDQTELKNRLWWYLFQIDHFLHESGAIPSSLLRPNSDDHDALGRLVRPMPCSLDDPSEATGASEWGHVLELWITRRKLVKEIQLSLQDDEAMMDKVNAKIQEWSVRVPPMPPTMLEAHMTINMEKCTNHGLLLHHFCPPVPDQQRRRNSSDSNTSRPLTSLQRRAILHMVECFTYMICFRRMVMEFKPCQTFPGDLKRSIEVLVLCFKYKDMWIRDRAKFGLLQARDVLANMAEIHWHDPICDDMVRDVESVLSEQSCLKEENDIDYYVDDDDDDHKGKQMLGRSRRRRRRRQSDDICSMKSEKDDDDDLRARSIKMENNMYSGVMMFDRDLQPRARYYKPARTSEPLDGLTIFENVTQYALSSSSCSSSSLSPSSSPTNKNHPSS
ncbi:hypothetical protein BDB00DRAFT_879200 [Zychaea mexicana]|uniref:uncharacterized protein n=1 Tax=Zychaea mexicana TaxID=64656 RepID=UPI0022FF27D7|nr:uncharacterized protein BDB00DRAFT_879200 [Zychaea mexicana]KAI9480240.1 hypothetical protein BDB00DRAFT_879200 [Zychaea mexicana]